MVANLTILDYLNHYYSFPSVSFCSFMDYKSEPDLSNSLVNNETLMDEWNFVVFIEILYTPSPNTAQWGALLHLAKEQAMVQWPPCRPKALEWQN